MKHAGPWGEYAVSYRAREIENIARWIAAGDSACVVGLAGCGRSHVLNFLCQRSDALQRYLPPNPNSLCLIPVDLYNLPSNDLACLYRTILHAFYWLRSQFDAEMAATITTLYLENRTYQDPFLPQMALHELLQAFRQQNIRIVLVLNRFDRFCQTATPHMMNTLRGLRDSFRETLSYVVGMLTDVTHLPDPESLGDMYELLVGHECWVGAMNEEDATAMVVRAVRSANRQPNPAQMQAILRLSGRFPNLLKAIAHWWLMQGDSADATTNWLNELGRESSIQFRLARIWRGLSEEEQLALVALQKKQNRIQPVAHGWAQQHQKALKRLAAKGLCGESSEGWAILSELLAEYIAKAAGQVRGGIWLDENARVVYQGQSPVTDLTPLQYEILRFLIRHPRAKHTRDDIIDNAWPDDEQREGITPNALHVHIANIRKKVEPDPAKPRYLITWNGRPGGYQFFPEGKPV